MQFYCAKRIEPLVTDLRKSLGDNMHTGQAYETYSHALRLVMERGGHKISAAGKEATLELMNKMMDQVFDFFYDKLETKFKDDEELAQSRLCSAGVIAATITQLDEPESALEEYLVMSGGPIEISSKLCVLAIIVKLKAELIIDNDTEMI